MYTLIHGRHGFCHFEFCVLIFLQHRQLRVIVILLNFPNCVILLSVAVLPVLVLFVKSVLITYKPIIFCCSAGNVRFAIMLIIYSQECACYTCLKSILIYIKIYISSYTVLLRLVLVLFCWFLRINKTMIMMCRFVSISA